MIVGVINASREATVPLQLRALDGHYEERTVIIDTGFSGYLTLPPDVIAALQLPFYGSIQARLGDGSLVRLRQFDATVIWCEEEREIRVLETDGGLLIGMQMLYGYRYTMDTIDGGEVRIEPR